MMFEAYTGQNLEFEYKAGRRKKNIYIYIWTESGFRNFLSLFGLQVFSCFWKVGPCQSWNFEFLEVF